MLSQFYSPLLLALFASISLAKRTTTTTKSTITTSSSTITPTPTLTSSTLLTSTTSIAPSCAGQYHQCGGIGFTGPTCCSAGLDCVIYNGSPYFYTCQAATSTPTSTSSSSSSSSSSVPTITTSAAIPTTTTPTSTSTCATSLGSCGPATPCCDSSLSCYTQNGLTNIPTNVCVIPCAYEYGQCGGVTWTGVTCCQPGLTCVNEGSPYFYNCQLLATTTLVTATSTATA